MTDWSAIDNRLLDPRWYVNRDEYMNAYRVLRDEDPIHWAVDEAYGKSYWFLTRYADVKEYLQRHDTFSSRWDTHVPKTPKRLTPEERFELGYASSMARNDPPIHDLYRRPINKHFSIPAIKKLQADVDAVVAEILQEIAERGECDLVEDLAGELPVRVVMRMIGVPDSDWATLRRAVWQWMAPSNPRYAIGDASVTAKHGHTTLLDYCEKLALDRRAKPKDDFASVLGQLTVDGGPLSVYELRTYLTVIIGGALDTTRSAGSVGLWLFMTHPDQRRRLLAEPGLASSAVDEVLRWASPANTRFRIAQKDVTFGGKDIQTGDWVIASHASANHDERTFAEPDRFDITRNPNPHLAFGEGIHMCLGRSLARLELASLFTGVLAALTDMEPLEEVHWTPDVMTASLPSLRVSFTPVAAPSP
jgi:cholest-4-en-3-one 26-monooxygenase